MGLIGPVGGGGEPSWRLGKGNSGSSKVEGGGEGLGSLDSFANVGGYAVHNEFTPSAVGAQGGGLDQDALQCILNLQLVFDGVRSRHRSGGEENNISLVGKRGGQKDELMARDGGVDGLKDAVSGDCGWERQVELYDELTVYPSEVWGEEDCLLGLGFGL
jgi:hypothetical protein